MSGIITILGATGVQGGSVVDTALAAGNFKVRAITRNVNSDKAKALVARGAEVVAGDINNIDSLIAAFAGSSYIYAVTDFFEPFASNGPEKGMKIEIEQGINIAKAASATATLKHFIWSTLPNSVKMSGGKYLVPHFEGKNKIDDYIRSDAKLFAKTTFLWVTFYASNFVFPMFTPNLLKSSGKHVQLQPAPASTPLLSIGDAGKNVGPFVTAIIAQPQLTLGGKFVIAYIEETTTGELLKMWGRAAGKQTAYVEVTSVDEYDDVWPAWGREMGVMMAMWAELKEKSWGGEELITAKMLGIDTSKLVGAQEALNGMDWSAY